MLDNASFERQRGLSTVLIKSSIDTGWTSALIERRRCLEAFRDFELQPTRDLCLVLQLDGVLNLQALKFGRWWGASFTAGAIGMTAPSEDVRIQGSSPSPFDQAHLFLPGYVLAEAGEALRRAGSPPPDASLRRLKFQDGAVSEAMLALLRAVDGGLPDLYAEQSMAWLALHLLSVHTDGKRGLLEDDRVDGRLRRALALVQDGHAQPLSLDTLSAEAGISKFHFVRRFRQLTGASPHRYVEERRMTEARRLLLETDHSVAEVGRRCGYPDAARFTAAFKRRHRTLTPSAYRRLREGASRGRDRERPRDAVS